MMSSLTRPLWPVDEVDGATVAYARQSVAHENFGARPGDDLLRHLPADRESDAERVALAEADYKIAGDRMEGFSQAPVYLGAGRDAFFLTVFATLLARLAGQEVVALRSAVGGPTMVTFAFDAEVTFRELLAATLHSDSPSSQACAVEFVVGAPEFPPDDPPHHGLRMTIHFSDSGGRVLLTSSTGRWNKRVLRLWLRYFDRLLTSAATAPDVPWKTLSLLDPIEAQEFYRTCNSTASADLPDLCVHELVTRQAERTPDASAIASESHCITYRQLHERSNAIAHYLRALGAGPDRPVAVCMQRTAELPVALLGVLKAGSSYVPLDPEDARQRLTTILEECRPVAIIVDRSFAALPETGAIPVMYLDDLPELTTFPECRASGLTSGHQAYIIYTSGTTGKPKGVMIPHRALANLLHSVMREPGFSARDRMLAVSPISFDIATMDMFLPLVAGGTLVVADRFVAADPFRLAALLKRFEITVLQATPATWRLLVSSGWEGKSDLKMISGGEALPRDLASRLLCLGAELWNCYGPTETTIYSGILRIQCEKGVVPIGPPIANTTFYVLDDAGQLLPPGVPGELYIGGVGVSPGYANRWHITRQRFLSDPYSQQTDARMFKSGDLVRLVNGQEFEFFGRLDQQVKLRGYRIELGEIESVLRAFPGIENAVAALRENGADEPYLIAYIAAVKRPDLRRLRDHLSQVLPSYMLPSRFVWTETMPLTTSGKIDRKVLLASNSASSGLTAYRQPEGVKPRTVLEEKLLTIFHDVLNTGELGVTDNFLDYGGYSLLTVKLFTRINRALNLRLPISLLFDAPNVQALASIIDRAQSPPMIVPIRPQGRSAPLFAIHSYLLYGVLPQMVEQHRPVYGVRESLDLPRALTVEDRAAMYVKEILKVYPDGPLLLTGWCAAGSLTIEIARQLVQLNHKVGLVALFDAERPGYRPPHWGNRAARLWSRVKFHLRKLRGVSTRQKLNYVRNAVRHGWDTTLESLFLDYRPLLLGLQRVFGFAFPEAAFNNTWSRVAALQSHTPVNYPGKVLLFRATDVPQFPGGDETLGWGEIVEEGVEVVFLPGDHESIFHDPNIHYFSQRLHEALRLVE